MDAAVHQAPWIPMIHLTGSPGASLLDHCPLGGSGRVRHRAPFAHAVDLAL